MNLVSLARKRVLACIAIVVMLFNLSAPALSHVVLSVSPEQDFLVEICTTTGIKFVKLDKTDSESRNHSGTTGQSDCAYCAWNFQLGDKPPVQVWLSPVSSPTVPHPRAVGLPPALETRWALSIPRAPPSSL